MASEVPKALPHHGINFQTNVIGQSPQNVQREGQKHCLLPPPYWLRWQKSVKNYGTDANVPPLLCRQTGVVDYKS